jgi:hypothetical protein
MHIPGLLTLMWLVLGSGAGSAAGDHGTQADTSERVSSDKPGLVCGGGDAGPDCTREPRTMRVRSSGDPTVTLLLHNAFERSASFRRLVETIDLTNGLIYVEPGRCGSKLRACLLMSVTVAGPNRILHVRVDTDRDPLLAIGSIGHELQHAVEALSEPGVTTSAQLHSFFERLVGGPTARGRLEFETDAAIRIGDAVYEDIVASVRLRQ